VRISPSVKDTLEKLRLILHTSDINLSEKDGLLLSLKDELAFY
jgi:hypothetical protein